jgi:hypothetical protein
MEGNRVSDSTGTPGATPWQSPSGSPRPPEFGEFGAPPPLDAPQAFGGPQPWMPPPKPGLIPLAPMTLGSILGASFRVLRRNPRPVVGISAIVHVVIAAATILTTTLFAVNTITDALKQLASGTATTPGELGNLLTADLAEFAVVGLGFVGAVFLQGIISLEVARGTVGERLPLRALLGRARGRILVLIGWSLAIVGVIVVTVGILIFVIAILAVSAGGAGAGFAVLILVVGFLGGAVLTVWLATKLSLVPSALVIERMTLGRAMRRSWSLVKGYFWRTFGIQVLVSLMLTIAASVVQTPVSIIGELLALSSNPTNPVQAVNSALTGIAVVSALVGALVGTVTSIVTSSTSALVYIDLRIRKEGLDLRLMQFVDARQAGVTLSDPYLLDEVPVALAAPPAPPALPYDSVPTA